MAVYEPVPIDLKDGKKRALKFTTRGFRAAQLANGKTFGELLSAGSDPAGFAPFLLAGLLWQEPALDIDQACDLIDVFLLNDGEKLDLVNDSQEGLYRGGFLKRPKAH